MLSVGVRNEEIVTKVTENIGKNTMGVGRDESNSILMAEFIHSQRLFKWLVDKNHNLKVNNGLSNLEALEVFICDISFMKLNLHVAVELCQLGKRALGSFLSYILFREIKLSSYNLYYLLVQKGPRGTLVRHHEV